MFKVNDIFPLFLLLTLNIFDIFFLRVSIVDSEQVNVSWLDQLVYFFLQKVFKIGFSASGERVKGGLLIFFRFLKRSKH